MRDRHPCLFCNTESAALANPLAHARHDRFPVTRGHVLIIPSRHVSDWFGTTNEEREAILALADDAQAMLNAELAPGGFNLGINVGEAAGQTVWPAHLRLMPRYRNDVPDPRGGVRGAIPGKQNY